MLGTCAWSVSWLAGTHWARGAGQGSIGWCPGCTTREQLNQTRYIQYADGKEKEEEEDRFEEVSYSRIKKGEREEERERGRKRERERERVR